MEYLDALPGLRDLNACATIWRANSIIVDDKSLKWNGKYFQFFLDCSHLGDTIIFHTNYVEPQNTTVIKHPMVFDVANLIASGVALKCPSAGIVFDAQ